MIQRSHSRTSKWNVIFRYTNIILAFVQGLLLVPLYLKYITVEIYGAWLESGNLLAWISTIDPGLTVVMNQQVSTFYGKGELKQLGKLITSGLMLSSGILILALSFGFFSSYFLKDILNLSDTDYLIIFEAFNYAYIGASLLLFSFSFSAINYGLQASLSVGLINVTTTLLSIILTITLLYYGYGLMSIAYSLVFSGLALSICNFLYLLFRLYDEKIVITFSLINFIYLSKLLGYTFLSRASGIISNNIDLLLISRFLGPESVASFALTKKPIDISKEFINQPVVAYQPIISNMVGSNEIDKLRKMLSRLIIILIWITVFFVGGMISLNSEFVSLWVGESFYIGSFFNLIICFSAFLIIVTQSAGYFSVSLGDIKRNSIAGALQSILYIPLIYFGLKYFGLYGLVFAPIISMIVTTSWYYPVSVQKLIKFSSNDIRIFVNQTLYSLISIMPLIIIFFFIDIKSWIEFISSVILFIIIYFSSLLYLSSIFRIEVRKNINLILKKI